MTETDSISDQYLQKESNKPQSKGAKNSWIKMIWKNWEQQSLLGLESRSLTALGF